MQKNTYFERNKLLMNKGAVGPRVLQPTGSGNRRRGAVGPWTAGRRQSSCTSAHWFGKQTAGAPSVLGRGCMECGRPRPRVRETDGGAPSVLGGGCMECGCPRPLVRETDGGGAVGPWGNAWSVGAPAHGFGKRTAGAPSVLVYFSPQVRETDGGGAVGPWTAGRRRSSSTSAHGSGNGRRGRRRSLDGGAPSVLVYFSPRVRETDGGAPSVLGGDAWSVGAPAHWFGKQTAGRRRSSCASAHRFGKRTAGAPSVLGGNGRHCLLSVQIGPDPLQFAG